MRNTFKAYERLKREQHIDTLFRTGKAFSVFPVKFIYLLVPRPPDSPAPAQAGFSVPKRNWRSSVKRHRIRRLMVESWRLNKQLLYPAIPDGQQLHVFLLFLDRTEPTQAQVHGLVEAGVKKLNELIMAIGRDKAE